MGADRDRRARQSAADDDAEYRKELAEWDWQETKNREAYSQYEVDLARLNEQNVRHWKDRTSWDAYNRELYIRDYNYRSDVQAYNASELAYNQQLDYNQMGAQLARDEQKLWLDEQLQQAAFAGEELSLTSQKQYDDLALQLVKSRETFDLVRANINLKHRSKSAEFAGKSMEAMVKTLQAKGKARARGQVGRTGRKTVQAIGALADFQQAMLNDMATKSELAFSNEQEQNHLQYQNVRAETRIGRAFVDKSFDLGKRKIQATKDSAFKQHQANILRIEYDKYGADMAAEGRRQSPPPAYDELPPIPAPYFTPETHISDAYKTKKKPPGPVGAPNLMAGAGLSMASNIVGSIASGVSAYGQYAGTGTGSGRRTTTSSNQTQGGWTGPSGGQTGGTFGGTYGIPGSTIT